MRTWFCPGYENMLRPKFVRPDCVADPTVCHPNAACDPHTRQCSCTMGHIGDGFVCNPDPQDCVLRKDLCSPEAMCIGRRCKCVEGFTGDGVKCVSLYQRSINCSECDVNAHCNGGMCQCNASLAMAFPASLFDLVALTQTYVMLKRSVCRLGNVSVSMDSVVMAIIASKVSLCTIREGEWGDSAYEGHRAVSVSPLPQLRHPSNEPLNSCSNRCDRETELCISGTCICKHGYKRHDDGRCLVFCEPDGMTLVLGNETTAFEGRIFVRGQAENPYCAKTFSPLQQDPKIVNVSKLAFEHCRFSNSKITEFVWETPPTNFGDNCFCEYFRQHSCNCRKTSMFINQQAADAYDLRCTYPVGVREVESNVNVSDLTTSSTLTDNAHGPSCRLTVTNEADESIAAAVVGQALRLRLEVTPNDTYSILPRNCFAINIETGERYSLTDKAGCAIDDQLFPEWTKIRPSLTEAVF
ncbi:hypothetical protein COOONC_20091, partial [Cooperia oncophora]